MFGAVTACVLAGLVALIRRMRWRVLLFQEGFVIERSGAKETVLWEQIKYLCESRTVTHGVESDHRIKIETAFGGKLTLDDAFRDFSLLAQTVGNRTYPCLLSKAETRLQRNETVAFGDLQLRTSGLGNEEESILWRDVEAVAVENKGIAHHLVIRKVGKKHPWYDRGVPDFPNFDLFLHLANKFLQENR